VHHRAVLRVLITFLILVVGQLFMFAAVQGQQTSVGVKVGDWAKYSVGVTWQSNIPGMVEPYYYQDLRNTEWLKVEVNSISGTNVTVILITHFKNDTETVQTLVGDVETGSGNLSLTFPFPFSPLIVKGDLCVGDRIPGLLLAEKVGKTVSQVYAGYHRDINYAEWVFSSFGYTMGEYYYFDKATGFLCEAREATSISVMNYSTSYSTFVTMTEVNMFSDQIHDIAIKDVIPSLTEIYIGDLVNITIMVKNEGTEIETFNVTVYWKSTEIWQQQVFDLAGGDSRNLSFTWNTTGLTKGAYMRVMIYLQNDFDASDNTFTYRRLTLKEPPPPPTPPPTFPLHILIYAVTGAGTVSVAVLAFYLWKIRKPKAKDEDVENSPRI